MDSLPIGSSADPAVASIVPISFETSASAVEPNDGTREVGCCSEPDPLSDETTNETGSSGGLADDSANADSVTSLCCEGQQGPEPAEAGSTSEGSSDQTGAELGAESTTDCCASQEAVDDEDFRNLTEPATPLEKSIEPVDPACCPTTTNEPEAEVVGSPGEAEFIGGFAVGEPSKCTPPTGLTAAVAQAPAGADDWWCAKLWDRADPGFRLVSNPTVGWMIADVGWDITVPTSDFPRGLGTRGDCIDVFDADAAGYDATGVGAQTELAAQMQALGGTVVEQVNLFPVNSTMNRVVDVAWRPVGAHETEWVIMEVKTGHPSLTAGNDGTQSQAQRDVRLANMNGGIATSPRADLDGVVQVEWHFFKSSVTQSIGPSTDLFLYLVQRVSMS